MIRSLPFEAVFADESGGNIKTPQSEYQSSGQFAVVDQGKSLIAGYVDDKARLCGNGRPALVFGDHTRCVKYVDFPFCMGADGVKVLRPKVDANLKYLYHYLKQIKIPNAGYDRHYKYLKRTEVLLPPLPVQIRIASILDQVDALRLKRREALAQLNSLTQAIFIEMFGGGEFPISTLEDMCELITDGTHQTPIYVDDGVIFLSAKNVTSGYIDWHSIKYIPNSLHLELHRRLSPKRGDILLAKNGTTGVAAIVDRDCTFDIYVSLALLRSKQGVLPMYLLGAINSPICKRQFNNALKGIGVPNLHLKDIRATKIPFPPMEQQKKFSERINAVEKVKLTQLSSLIELDNLFSSLQHRAFRGEL